MTHKNTPLSLNARTPTFLDLDDRALLAQCEVDTYRASGPGGQKRNKTASAIRLRHQPTGMIVTAVESRSQHENKARALKRLRRAIAMNVRRTVCVDDYKPSERLASCISQSAKLCVGRRDYRYPAAVWEILDVLHACGMQLSKAAGLIGVSTANLSHFLHEDPTLWRRVNEMRTAAGLKGLR